MSLSTAPIAKNKSYVQSKSNFVAAEHVVKSTKDYHLFKILNGNRKPNDLHVRRLIQSFEKVYLFSPILINERYEIIDGQHRFLAAKELGLEIFFITVKGYGLKEVQILNTNSSNWKKEDYLKAYCDLGIEAYIIMKDFMDQYPDFGIACAEYLLTNISGGSNNRNSLMKGGRGKQRNFEEGKLIIHDLELAKENAENILLMKPYYNGYNREIFVASMLGLFKNENYVHSEMVSKLALQPTILQHCANVAQYRLLLEEIYNYRRREKVNLRY